MRYLNRAGTWISRDQWTALIRCPEYTAVASDHLEDFVIVATQWLGLVMDGENPTPYFTGVTRQLGDTREEIASYFSSSEELALLRHDALVQGVRGQEVARERVV